MNFLHLPGFKNFRVYAALILGTVFGLSIYGYWLVDVFPPTSRRVILFTILACLGGTIIYLRLIESWVIPRLSAFTRLQRWYLAAWSILAGAILMFAGTSAWMSPSRYLTFLLPNEKLEISVRSKAPVEVEILWFNTSLGDVSYDSINYKGWKRTGDRLILADPQNNSLEWTGRTGNQAVMVLSTSPRGGAVDISWDGVSENVDLFSEKGGRLTFTHDFEVPFYASRAAVILFGVINFGVFCFAIYLSFREKSSIILRDLNKSILYLSNGDDGKKVVALELAIVFGTIIVAILLRIFNLDHLPPYTDEYAHLLAAKALVHGSALVEIYQRSLFIVTLPVAFFFQVFGVSIWAGRLAGVLFNVLAIVPLYLITRKINKSVAFISCILYATSPWVIAVARNVREYAYYPFYFYWIIYAMILFVEHFPGRFVVGDYKKLVKPVLIFSGLALIVPVIYSLSVDPQSTFMVILISYVVLGFFLLGKINLNNKLNQLFLAITFVGVILTLYVFMGKLTVALVRPHFDGYSVRYFLFNPQQQWYFNKLAVFPLISLLGAVFIGWKFYRTNFLPSFLFGHFLVYVLFFLFFFDRYIRPRYLISVQFWLIPLISIGLFALWSYLKLVLPGKDIFKAIVMIVILFLSFNGPQVLMPTLYDATGYMPITEEYHDDVEQAQSFLLNRVNENDVLISTVFGSYVDFTGNLKFKAIYPYDRRYSDPQGYIFSIVEQHDSGWIVLDDRRYELSTPLTLNTTVLKDRKIEYVGLFANQYIWHWRVE